MYLAGITENISGIFVLLAWLNAIILFVVAFSTLAYCSEQTKADVAKMDFKWQKFAAKVCIPSFILCCLTQALIPDQKTMYTILAAKVATDFVNSPGFNQTSDNVLKLINAKLVSMTKDINDEMKPA